MQKHRGGNLSLNKKGYLFSVKSHSHACTYLELVVFVFIAFVIRSVVHKLIDVVDLVKLSYLLWHVVAFHGL